MLTDDEIRAFHDDGFVAVRGAFPRSALLMLFMFADVGPDVFLCHPFLVHAAQPHHGTRPRLMAQPPLEPAGPLDLDSPAPVAVAIRAGLRS